MRMIVDAREPIFRPYWASQGDGVQGNYFHPTKAIAKQYSWINTPGARGGGLPSGSVILGPNLPAQPGDLLGKNTDYQGQLKSKPYQPYEQRPQFCPTGYNPQGYIPNQQVYSSGFVSRFGTALNNLWWDLKIFVLKILSRIGLYKGLVPTHPRVAADKVVEEKAEAQVAQDQPAVDAAEYHAPQTAAALTMRTLSDKMKRANEAATSMYEGPFDSHTIIFSKEVIP